MSSFDFFPAEIWINIFEQLITLRIDFLNPKQLHVRSVVDKWHHAGAFKMAYPFLRMVSHDFKRLMDELKTKHFDSTSYKPLKGFELCIAMAAEGRLLSLQYLHENGAKWTEETCNYAALHDRLDCLMYAHEHGCRWSSEVCALAALNGSFNCLKYAHENGCAWDTDCCTNAAQRGDLNMIQYLISNGCSWSAQTTNAAAQYGHFELLQYLYDKGCPKNQATIAQKACYSGKIEILKYVLENGAQVNKNLCMVAASVNALECLQYLRENGSSWDVDVINAALQSNSHDCVKYAIDHGCPRDEKSIHLAIGCGNLHALKQLDPAYDYRSQPPYHTLSAAARSGSVACLKYLIEEKGVPVERRHSLLLRAQMYGYEECVEYLQRLPATTDQVITEYNLWMNTQ